MNRAITAIYRTYAAAQQVRDAITEVGVSSSHVDIIPDTDDQLEVGSTRDDETLDDLHDLHLPEDDIRTYQQAVRRGDYVVSANVEDDHVERVMEAMRRPEGEMYDIDRTEDEFRTANYVAPMTGARSGMGLTADTTTDESMSAAAADREMLLERDTARTRGDTEATANVGTGDREVFQEAEERLRLGKRDVAGGSVHIRSYVHEVPVEERIQLRHERVEIRRQAMDDRVLTGAEADAVFKERSIDVTEHNEEAVVSKETVVTGEVGISKDADTEEKVVSDTVRKTEVEVEDDRKIGNRNEIQDERRR